MDLNTVALLLVFLPLIAAAVVGMSSRWISDRVAQVITCGAVSISAICAGILFNQVALGEGKVHLTLLPWFASGDFIANWSVYVDVLTAVMLVVVTWVSALVHIYSVGYMSHDEFKPRFMAYLSLFTFCMIMLVTSDNFAQLFFGWEGVGVCSYLLIGFWFKKPTANAAAIKAFLVNRVGDFGFGLGIFLTFWTVGSIEFTTVFAKAPEFANTTISFLGGEFNVLTVACLLLFMGAMGKSAQIGLHTWLPDAMEGPTPVSALIHAATMVTAGVFMVARCSPMFEYSPAALSVVTLVGATTCLFAASVALVQNDIKRIIAYSTCSQLGYMFFACGVSAYGAGIFHLMTHGFFKALLFLGAGSVIHALSDEQDIRKMGGVWKKIPFTYAVMWIGSLALAGVFPFAGFFSKDIVLEAAYASAGEYGELAYWMGLLAAIFTAFYSWRLIFLSFHGKARASQSVMRKVHESPLIMTIPLFLLAIGAIFSGGVGALGFGMVSGTGEFWRGSIVVLEGNNSIEAAHHVAWIIKLLPLLAGVAGIGLAFYLYMKKTHLPARIKEHAKFIYYFLLNKWYFDEIFDFLFVRPSKAIGDFLWRRADDGMVDGMPNGMAHMSQRAARVVSFFQSGFIYNYAFVMLLGLLGFLSWVMFIH